MRPFVTLLQREWMQHRFGWTLMALIPLGLSLLLLSFGQIELDTELSERSGSAFPALVAGVSILATTLVTFAIFWLTASFMIAGVARRDHQDRSIEFWLSMPTSHSASLAAPLLMHLLIVPAAALLLGLASGYLVSLVVVTRVAGFEAWLGLPWGSVLLTSAAGLVRLLAGLPLAELWLAPLTMALMLFGAWFKRWGIPLAFLVLGLGSLLLDRYFQQPVLLPTLRHILENALYSFVGAGAEKVHVTSPQDVVATLQAIRAWALSDLNYAWRNAVSLHFAGGLLVAGALFALLVDWRRRGR